VAEFDIMYDEGISMVGDLLDIAVELGVVDKRGSYYYYEDESMAQGRENAKQYLRDNPPVANKLEIIIREQLELEGAPPLLEDDGHLEAEDEPETEALLEDEGEELEEASLEGEVSEAEELEAVAEPA
jgi:recombination protein RecA